jgi:hypothetical protein
MVKCITKLLFSLTLLSLLVACTSDHIIDIEGKDDNAIYSVQTSFPITKSETPLYLKLRTSKIRADFSQLVPDGKYIFYEDIQITGPDAIDVDSDITATSISLGFVDNALPGKKFSIAVFIGVSKTDFNADVIFQSGPRVFVRDNIKELYLDAGLWYEVAERLRIGLALAMSMNADISGMNEVELALSYRMFTHLELAIGLRDFTYNYNEGDSRSGITVQSRGPFVSLNFPF